MKKGQSKSARSMTLPTPPPIYKPGMTPNWSRPFPIHGQGTCCFNIVRNNAFALVVRDKENTDWISLDIHANVAFFTMMLDGKQTTLEVTRLPKAGYEPDVKVTYWFSYDRDGLKVKYGKGYRMVDTTIMVHDYLKGVTDEKEQEEIRKMYHSLFNPVDSRVIEQYDEDTPQNLRSKYKNYIEKLSGGGSKRARVEMDAHLNSLLDLERKVEFDRYPVTVNRPPTILDSSKLNLFYLDKGQYTFSASLPSAALELYENVKTCELDYPAECDTVLLSDAIRHSIETEGCILNKKLHDKADEFAGFQETYLRVTLGSSMGKSPGIPYVLEIWPKDHGSPIHNHGNANAVIKVLHGSINISVYNKFTAKIVGAEEVDEDEELLFKFDARKGDVTWMDRNWYQTHKLWNITDDFCATIQCYNYAPGDTTHWPYFDYIGDCDTIQEFYPNTDFTFEEMRTEVMQEYKDSLNATC